MRLISGGLVLAGVLAVTATPSAAQDMSAEVIHWWTSEGESAAIRQFAEAYDARGGKWIDNAVAGGSNAKKAAISRMVAGDPPTANQFNTSREFEDLIDKGLLADLEAHAQAGKWRDVMPEALINVASRNGKFYALPVNVHGQSWIWYSAAVLEKAGVEPPSGWSDIFDALDKLKAAGFIPLAVGGQSWQERGLFLSVMIELGGVDNWYAVFRDHDEAAITGPTMRKVWETYGRLRDYVDEGSPGRSWNLTTGLVVSGKAGFQMMGDWAKGEFIAAGMSPGKEYGCILPGGKMVIGGDVFVFPVQKDASKKAAQDLLVEVMFDKETQVAFNNKKGSVPARTDVDTAGMDLCGQAGMAALQNAGTRVPRAAMILPADVAGDLQDLYSEFWNNKGMSVDEAIERHLELLSDA